MSNKKEEMKSNYYDEVKGAWVEESIDPKTGMKVSLSFPSEKAVSFEKVKEKYTKKASEMFQDNYVKEKYMDFFEYLSNKS